MSVKDIMDHIVDLDKSKLDMEKSDPKRGAFVFDKVPNAKVYVPKKSAYAKDASLLPPVMVFPVSRMEDDLQSGITYWRFEYGAEPIVAGVDPYWPEPLKPDAEGHYVYKDTIFVKVDTFTWLNKIDKDRKRFDKAADQIGRTFQAQAETAGGGLHKGDVD